MCFLCVVCDLSHPLRANLIVRDRHSPITVEQQFGMLSSLLPGPSLRHVKIRRLSETSTQAPGWGLISSVAVALWSANAGTQAMFAALNIAYEEPERRSLLRYYLSAFTFTLIGMLSGLVMLNALRNCLCAHPLCHGGFLRPV